MPFQKRRRSSVPVPRKPSASQAHGEKLEKFAAYFGQGGSEIFPKQVTIGKDENDADYGNWINMPYNGETDLRYRTNESNERVPMEDFPDYCKARMLTASRLSKI